VGSNLGSADFVEKAKKKVEEGAASGLKEGGGGCS